MLIGSLVGCVATGIGVYLTGSPFAGILALVCALLGGWFASEVKHSK